MRTDGSDQRFYAYTGGYPGFDKYDSLLHIGWMLKFSPDTGHIALTWPADSSVRSVFKMIPGDPYIGFSVLSISHTDRHIALSIDVNIFTMTIQGTQLTKLTTDGGVRPSWSPDGAKILYVKRTLEGGSLWIMNSDGSNRTQIPGW